MMRGAPVTTACLGIVVATSTALSQSLLTLVLDKNPNTLTSLLRPLLTSFPSMPHAPSGWSYLCLLVFVFQLRHLERLWGSARFLTLLGVASVLGRVGAQLAVFGSTPISEATRLSHLLALVIPVSALATRYQTDMPALERVPLLFLKKVAISEKILAFAIAFCLIFFSPSSSRFLSSNHPHASVRPVSIAIHVLLALSGVVLGYLSRPPASRRQRRSLLVQLLDRIVQRVSRPLVDYVIAPLMSPLTGPTSSIEHVVPARLQQAQRATRAVGGHAVGNLLGGDQDLHDGIPNEAWERILREQQALNAATPTSPNVGNTRRQFPPYRQREEFTAPEVDPLKLQLLKDLQLGASDDKIREALVVSGGDVDAAAAYLLSHEQ